MSKKVALVDLDYTISDWHGSMIPELLKLESSDEVGKYDYSNTWKLEAQYPHISNRIKAIMSKRGFWKNLKPIEAGMQLYRYINERFKTYIVTKANKYCDLVWGEKAEWVHKNLGYDVNLMVVTDKEQIKGDLLFDDDTRNVVSFLKTNPQGKVIIPIRPHNASFTIRSDINPKRYCMWDDSPTNHYISGEIKLDVGNDKIGKKFCYDFTLPHRIINEVLAQD